MLKRVRHRAKGLNLLCVSELSGAEGGAVAQIGFWGIDYQRVTWRRGISAWLAPILLQP